MFVWFVLLVLSGQEKSSPDIALRGGVSSLVKGAARTVSGTAGQQVVRGGRALLQQEMESLVSRFGPEVHQALRKLGVRATQLLEEAGDQGPQVVKLLARYGEDSLWIVARPQRVSLFARFGDEAAEAMLKHGEVAEPLLQAWGQPAARALGNLAPLNGRRLAMLAADGELQQIGRTPELLDVISRSGDRALEFVWRHKGALAVTAALAAFLQQPEAFLGGAVDITQVAAESLAQPIVAIPGQVAEQAARSISWTWVLIVGVLVCGAVVAFRLWLRHQLFPMREEVIKAERPRLVHSDPTEP